MVHHCEHEHRSDNIVNDLYVKASFSFHKPIPKNTQMTTLYNNLSL